VFQHRPDHVPAQQQAIQGSLSKGGTIPSYAKGNLTILRDSLSTSSRTLSRHGADVLIAVGRGDAERGKMVGRM
jgi:hypothetical protein